MGGGKRDLENLEHSKQNTDKDDLNHPFHLNVNKLQQQQQKELTVPYFKDRY